MSPKSKRKSWRLPLMFLLLLLFNGCLTAGIRYWVIVGRMPEDFTATPEFRALMISPENFAEVCERSGRKAEAFGKELAAAMVVAGFDLRQGELPGRDSCHRAEALLLYYRHEDFLKLSELYTAIFQGTQVYPVPDRKEEPDRRQTSYEDNWMVPRNYGGNRNHEGIDIFGAQDLSGYYPVLSITEGTVEKLGWLPLGGYRVGVRSDAGVYYYYAHLDSYAHDLQVGKRVQAGELLGFLGDTGYGEEGTRGKFVPHLHLGLYLRTEEEPELAVNPYDLLRILEKNIRRYRY